MIIILLFTLLLSGVIYSILCMTRTLTKNCCSIGCSCIGCNCITYIFAISVWFYCIYVLIEMYQIK